MSGLLNTRQIGLQIFRTYAFKSDLKIKWVRPEKISCILPEKSGDVPLPKLNPKEIIPEFRDCKELANIDDSVKSFFTLENSRRIHTSDLYRELFVKKVQRHRLDYGSMEAKIAEMTATIRRFQELMVEFPQDKKRKVQLKEMIEKRKKFLKYLRRWDYRRFEWILEKLELIYKPPPAEFHWITRKESLRKLTNEHCENVKNERLNEYKKQLESQQVEFLERKLNNLKFMRKEQEECFVSITVTQEEITNVQKQLEDLKKKRSEINTINENI